MWGRQALHVSLTPAPYAGACRLFTHPELFKRQCVMMLGWFTCSMVFYGTTPSSLSYSSYPAIFPTLHLFLSCILSYFALFPTLQPFLPCTLFTFRYLLCYRLLFASIQSLRPFALCCLSPFATFHSLRPLTLCYRHLATFTLCTLCTYTIHFLLHFALCFG